MERRKDKKRLRNIYLSVWFKDDINIGLIRLI